METRHVCDIYEIFLRHPAVTTDSRRCAAGSIFFALKGESFNGNEYAAAALEKGCAYAVVDEERYAVGDRYILVDDALKALQDLAAWHRERLSMPVIQITGTNGKTTTKELVSAVLASKYRTVCTQGNLNNHIGVPLTLLSIRPEHEMAVVETGANHPGEIEFLCRMVKADAGLVTNVGRAHLEGFGGFDGVKRTKGELYDDLHRRGGLVFLNASDGILMEMAVERGFVLGENALPYVEGRVAGCDPFLQVEWRTDTGSPWRRIRTHLIGAYNISNICAAVTVGLHYGVSPDCIDKAIGDYVPSNDRSEFRKTASNSLVVDAYNANPSSMAAAFANFAFINARHKMVILGEMRELGEESLVEHAKVLAQLSSLADIEKIWLVGGEFEKALAECPLQSATCFASVEDVKSVLAALPLTGYTILIKGSHGTRLWQLPGLL